MTQPKETPPLRLSDASLAAGRAAGYCWLPFGPHQRHCTRPPGHPGPHKSYYYRDGE